MNRHILFISALIFALPAFAVPPANNAEMQALKTYCMADIQRLCPHVQPGGGRIKQCLMANQNNMSVGCAKALQQLKANQGK